MTLEIAAQLLMSIYASGVAHNHSHTLRLKLEAFIANQLPGWEMKPFGMQSGAALREDNGSLSGLES